MPQLKLVSVLASPIFCGRTCARSPEDRYSGICLAQSQTFVSVVEGVLFTHAATYERIPPR